MCSFHNFAGHFVLRIKAEDDYEDYGDYSDYEDTGDYGDYEYPDWHFYDNHHYQLYKKYGWVHGWAWQWIIHFLSLNRHD